MKKLHVYMATLVALAIALCVTAANAAPSVEAIQKALVAANPATLAGDQPRARTIAAAIDSASLEAVCAPPWADSDFCQAVWPGTRTELAAALIVQGTLTDGSHLKIGFAGQSGGGIEAGLAPGRGSSAAAQAKMLADWLRLANVRAIKFFRAESRGSGKGNAFMRYTAVVFDGQPAATNGS